MQEYHNILSVNHRADFRSWLSQHATTEVECWVEVRRGKPVDDTHFWYLNAVEEALCFGWIDSTQKVINNIRLQRFTPRKKNSPWSELNKERVRRLERLGLMTDAGRAVLPDMDISHFRVDPEIETAMKKARVWSKFKSFPELYQRIRAYNVAFYKNIKKDPQMYERGLLHLIEETKKGNMYGEWNDYGRLL